MFKYKFFNRIAIEMLLKILVYYNMMAKFLQNQWYKQKTFPIFGPLSHP